MTKKTEVKTEVKGYCFGCTHQGLCIHEKKTEAFVSKSPENIVFYCDERLEITKEEAEKMENVKEVKK